MSLFFLFLNTPFCCVVSWWSGIPVRGDTNVKAGWLSLTVRFTSSRLCDKLQSRNNRRIWKEIATFFQWKILTLWKDRLIVLVVKMAVRKQLRVSKNIKWVPEPLKQMLIKPCNYLAAYKNTMMTILRLLINGALFCLFHNTPTLKYQHPPPQPKWKCRVSSVPSGLADQ